METPAHKLRRPPVRCDLCGTEVGIHQMTVRMDRRRWIYYGAALVSMVLLWWLLMVLGVPGHVMQYGMFFVNLPAVFLVLMAHRYPSVRAFTCPGCGAERAQPVTRARKAKDRHAPADATTSPPIETTDPGAAE